MSLIGNNPIVSYQKWNPVELANSPLTNEVDPLSYPTPRSNLAFEVFGLAYPLLSTKGLIDNKDVVTFAMDGTLNGIISSKSAFDPTSNQDITGEWSFSLNSGQTQLLLTDDPTLVSPTYIFGTYNHPSWAPTLFADTRLIDQVNSIGYAATAVDGSDSIVGLYNRSSELKLWYDQPTGLKHLQSTSDVVQLLGIRYADTTALNLAIVSPAVDQYVMVEGKGLAVYNGSDWVHAADDTTPINDPLTGGGGIATWTPTEVETPLLITENISNVTIATVGNDHSLTIAGSTIGSAKSGPNTRMVSGINGLYIKLNEPDDGTLPTGANFKFTLCGYPTTPISSFAPYINFVKGAANTWTAYVGRTSDESTVVIADANIHEAEMCIGYEVVDADQITITLYTAGNSTPIITKTITTGTSTAYYTSLRFSGSSTGAAALEVLVIGNPASVITGVTQIVTTGTLDITSYPASRANKTYQVTGLAHQLNDTTANKIVSNGCLVTFDSNSNLITSTSEANNIVFYLDWTYGDTFILDDNAYWNNGANGPTFNPGGTLALGTRREHLVTQVLTPNGDYLNKYKIVSVRPQIRSDSMWLTPGWIYSAGGQGTTADNHENSSSQRCVVIQSGGARLSNDSAANGGSTGSISASTSPKYARIRIVARK